MFKKQQQKNPAYFDAAVIRVSLTSGPSVLFSQVVSGKSLNLFAFITSKNSPASLHLSSPFLLTLYLNCLIRSHQPSDFASTAPHDLCTWTPHPSFLDLYHSIGCILHVCPHLCLFPLLSFPPANYRSVLAIFGVSPPSPSSSCHSFLRKSFKPEAFAALLCDCMVITDALFQGQEEPGIRNGQCGSMWHVWECLMDPITKERHIATFKSPTTGRSLALRLASFASDHCLVLLHCLHSALI